MTKTKITVTSGIGLLIVVVAAMVVKGQFSSSASDGYFVPDGDKLRQAPANLVIVRQSHFSPSLQDRIKHIHENDSLVRTVGRNVSFRSLMAEAYDCDPGRVVLPADAPKGGFDFLVTMPTQTRKHLRMAIQKNLGYVAHQENRETEVWLLKVTDPALPGLTVSPASEEEDMTYQDGKLHFTHEPMSVIRKGLEAGLGRPVVDQTGLTNCYDFSVGWNEKLHEKIKMGTLEADGVKKYIGTWGLGLEPDTTNVDLLIVEKASR